MIGKIKMSIVAKEIASYLKLRNPQEYTGHCFRRTSADYSCIYCCLRKKREKSYIENSVENSVQINKKISK